MKIKIEEIKDDIIGKLDEDKINTIAKSIKEVGQLQPIAVTRELKLVTGRSRLEALKQLRRTEVEAVYVEDNPQIRLHENIHRRHLSWYEEAELIAQLHNKRQTEHGKAEKGRGKKGGWSQKDTARELGKAVGSISESMNLVKAVADDPSLKKIKDKATAIKLVRNRAQQIQQEEESGIHGTDIKNEIFLGDSATVLRSFPKSCFHAVITDPPWVDFAGHNKLTKDSDTFPVFRQIYRTMETNSFLYMFVGHKDFEFYRDNLPRLGFSVQPTPLIWHKLKFLSRRASGYFYGRNYELILVAYKGDPVLYSKTQIGSVYREEIVHSSKLIHPNEKPQSIIKALLEHCTVIGNLVLDPFAGSFVVPEVCKKEWRNFIAIERDKKFFDQGRRRLGIKR